MKFEKTGLFYSLLNCFTNYGKEIINDYGRAERAKTFTARFVKLYGVEKNRQSKRTSEQNAENKNFLRR